MRRTGLNLKKVSGIYSAIHRTSGICYVGSGVDIWKRFLSHRSHVRVGRKSLFHRALKEFGEDQFDFEVLEECAPEYLRERERFYIVLLGAASVDGFNVVSNPANAGVGYQLGAATRQRMSAARKGLPVSIQHRNSLKAAWVKGRVITAATRKKMSDSAKKRKASQKTRNKMSLAHSNPSKTTRAKLSVARKGYVMSEEVKDKIRQKHIGKIIPLEMRQRISEKLKGRKTKPISDETRAKLRAKHLGKTMSLEARQRMKDGWARKRLDRAKQTATNGSTH